MPFKNGPIAKTSSRQAWTLLIVSLITTILTFFGFFYFENQSEIIVEKTLQINQLAAKIETDSHRIANNSLELRTNNGSLVQAAIRREQEDRAAEVFSAIERLQALGVNHASIAPVEKNVLSLLRNSEELLDLLHQHASTKARVTEVIAFVRQYIESRLRKPFPESDSTVEHIAPEIIIRLYHRIFLLISTVKDKDPSVIDKASADYKILQDEFDHLSDELSDSSYKEIRELHEKLSFIYSREHNLFTDNKALLILDEQIQLNYVQSHYITKQLSEHLEKMISTLELQNTSQRRELDELRYWTLALISSAAMCVVFLAFKFKRLIERKVIARIHRLAQYSNASANRETVELIVSQDNDEITTTERSVQNFVEQRNALEARIRETLKERTNQLSLESEIVNAYFFGSKDGLGIVQNDGAILRSNSAFKTIFSGKLRGGPQPVFIGQVFEEFLENTSNAMTFEDEAGKTFRVRSIPIKTNPGPQLSLYVFEDISDYIKAEHKEQALNKMRLLGELSGSVAHDFNNTLSIFQGISELLISDSESRISRLSIQEMLQSAIDQGISITSQLLSYTKDNTATRNDKSADQLLHDAASLAEHINMGKVNIALDLQSTAIVNVKAELLINALLNLFTNAKDASESSGLIVFRCADRFDGQQDWVCFEVQDFGSGIKDVHLPRITEPLFSTKPQGTGVGLSSVLRFTNASGGKLAVKSEVGAGTTVSLRLPVSPFQSRTASSDVHENESAARKRSILVVDDNAAFLELLTTTITCEGHSVDSSDSLDSVRTLIAQDKQWQLVICDVHLGAFHAADVLNLFRQNNLNSQFIFITGNLTPQDEVILRQLGPFPVLCKPFKFAELHQLIQLDFSDFNALPAGCMPDSES